MSIRIRKLVKDDIDDIQRGVSPVAEARTSNLPHPYPPGGAADWFDLVSKRIRKSEAAVFTIRNEGFAGILSLNAIDTINGSVEFDYWVLKKLWGKGYCTKAVKLGIDYAADELKVDAIFSAALVRNVGSCKVLKKNGFSETHRFVNEGQFGSTYLEPMIRFRKNLKEDSIAVRDMIMGDVL